MKNTLNKILLLAGVFITSASFAQRINAPGSPPNYKPSVASPVDLPLTGNTPGDTRVSVSNSSIYIWDGSAWQGTAGGGAAMWGSIGGGNSFASVLTNSVVLSSVQVLVNQIFTQIKKPA